ncbi:uncharacterized protein LOC125944405 [Dermacentor silvarum]|uniref:uncharacterized protein LOC125944405 n=1 Tax=Dermacentor silvarum TaxID=543639 RepID=UPI002100950A|nr:uncharacterized protein LOC125944405 [Dermacentor silvarum]
MELSMERDIPAVIPRAGPASNNFTAQNPAPAITNSFPHESANTQHFSLSGQAFAAAPTSKESTEDQLSFSYINAEVHYTLLLIIMVSSVAINGLVFVLFYQRPSIRMTSNKFVLNMAIVHLLQTFIVLPFVFVSVMFQEWIFGDIFCKIHGTVSMCLTMANVFSILLIAVDRNCAVNSPLHYSMTITKKRTSVLIVSTWVCALVVSVPPLVGVSGLQYQKRWAMCSVTWYDTGQLTLAYACVLSVLGFLLPFIRITWIYASMLQAARRNSACTRIRNVKSGSNEISPPSSAGPDGRSHLPVHLPRKSAWSKRTSSHSQASSLFGDKLKAVRTGVFVVVSFTACFLPFFAMTLVETQHAHTLKTPLRNLPAIAMLLLFSSSLINPYLYVIRNKATRKHVRKMFACLKRKPSFFSPLGYHYSHQSPLRERKCSGGTRAPESTASLRSCESEEYQRSLMRHSLYRNKSGEWKIVAVTIDPNLTPSRRSSVVVHHPLCVDEMEEQPQQLFQQENSHLRNTHRPVHHRMAVRNSFYRRASLDNPEVPSERFSRNCQRYVKPTSTNATIRSTGDRSKSFRIRGRYANRNEPTAACDRSCNSSINHEEWCRYFIDSCQPHHGSSTRYESRSSASVLAGSAETNQVAPHSPTSMAHVQRCGSVPSEYNSYATTGHPCRPALKRGRSFAFEEREMSVVTPSQAISQFGGLRKSQFAMAKRSRKQSSSDTNTTTLESLTSTESQELSMLGSPRSLSPTSSMPHRYPPPHACQHHQQHRYRVHGYSSMPLQATILSQQQQQHIELSRECHDRRDSGFEDTMLERCDLCDTVVNESDSIKTMKLIEHL